MQCTFLVPDKKSTKRNRLWGGVESKASRYCDCNLSLYPAFEPPSPQTPLPAPVENLAVVVT